MATAKGDQTTVRALNRRLLLRLLRERGPMSRTDLAELSGLSNGAITRIVADLIDEGYLWEQAVGDSTGGRRPVLLDLDTSARVVAGLKLMDDAILAVLVDTKGVVVTHGRAALRSHRTDVVLSQAAALIDKLLARASRADEDLTGIGLCMPGVVDWQTGFCKVSPYFGWRDVPVAKLLYELTNVPVAVDNDVNALAVAESLFGRGRRIRDFVVITMGRGVGAGLVHDGSVYRGHNGGAGEFGHIASEVGGRRCECGKRGCLEAYVSEPALLAQLREMGGRYAELDIEGFLTLARSGDKNAKKLYDDTTMRLGSGIATLVNVLNPELIVVGGEATFLTHDFVEDLWPRIVEHTFGGLADGLEIQLDGWRSDPKAWARGAASLAMEHLFDPLMQGRGVAALDVMAAR
jgi:predicted NBD/HSP70 family sugar kinase